jgi:hypothetical protein
MISTHSSLISTIIAIRQELSMKEPADLRSSAFERFVIRLSERLDLDIPREVYPTLTTLEGCRLFCSSLPTGPAR